MAKTLSFRDLTSSLRISISASAWSLGAIRETAAKGKKNRRSFHEHLYLEIGIKNIITIIILFKIQLSNFRFQHCGRFYRL